MSGGDPAGIREVESVPVETVPVESLEILHSVLDPALLRRCVESFYDLGKILDCRLLLRGINDTYQILLADQQRFVLRLYRHGWRVLEDALYEAETLSALAARGAPLARPVPTSDGRWAFSLEAPEGPRPALLFEWAEGASGRYHRTLSGARGIGEAVALLHRAGEKIQTDRHRPLGLEEELVSFLPDLRRVLRHRPRDWRAVEDASQRTAAALSALGRSLPRGLCHGDIHGGNALVTEEGQVTLIDFDVCGEGYLAFDYASYLWSVDLFQWQPKYAREFAAGYRSIRPLSSAEKAAVPLFKIARDAWHLGTWAHNVDALGCLWFHDRELSFRLDLFRRLLRQAGL